MMRSMVRDVSDPLGDALRASTSAAQRPPASVRSALARVLTMLVALSVFVFGALLPDLRGADSLGPAWLGIAALVSALVLPLLAYGSAVGAVHRLLDGRSASPVARRLELCLVAAATTAVLVYLSPWGLSAVRWAATATD
jgi:hypothetical protein